MSYLNLVWRAEEVKPDTTYIDEPTETVPEGWYVVGHALDADDVEDRCRAEIRVQWSVNADGEEIAATLAHRVASLLNKADAA